MSNMNRRKFLSFLSVSTALPTLTFSSHNTALAADLPMVNAESAQAMALKYTPLSQVEGQSCSTCALYQGKSDAKLGMCPLFAGSNVSADALCIAWAKKG
ncbi:MAG: hypothetical protein ACI9XK_001713 [Granulosicoccus sp.]|jgi:hypothetical protein